MHRLLSEVVHAVEHDAEASADGEVLLDITVGGVRCVFIRRRPTDAAPAIQLSPREREIVRMVAAGYPNKTIATVLDISSWTVGTHLRHVFAKLGVSSRAAMVSRLHDLDRIASTNGGGRGAPLDTA